MRKWIARIVLLLILAAFIAFLIVSGEWLNVLILFCIVGGAFGAAALLYFLIKWAF